MYLNSAGTEKLQDPLWLISAILAQFSHLRRQPLSQANFLFLFHALHPRQDGKSKICGDLRWF
jgi:hypothetical protein